MICSAAAAAGIHQRVKLASPYKVAGMSGMQHSWKALGTCSADKIVHSDKTMVLTAAPAGVHSARSAAGQGEYLNVASK